MDKVSEMEKRLIPEGKVAVLGAGRLGIRVLERLVMVHRGGFSHFKVFDGGTIEENDFYHLNLGALLKENKASFFKRKFLTPDTRYKEIEAFSKDFSLDDFEKLEDVDVVISTIAGGDTIPLIAEIGKFCVHREIPFITTNGVFGFGDESVNVAVSIDSVKVGPALFLKDYAFPVSEKTVFVGTGYLIKDGLPITPMTLDKVADLMVTFALKLQKRMI